MALFHAPDMSQDFIELANTIGPTVKWGIAASVKTDSKK